MRRVVLLAVVLYIAAHVLPAYARDPGPAATSMTGWQISSQTMTRFMSRPARWLLRPRARGAAYATAFVAWLANPFFWTGVAAILVSGRTHPRGAGAIAAVAGCAAVACAVGYLLLLPPAHFSSMTLLPGGYLWGASLIVLATLGLYLVFVRKDTQETTCIVDSTQTNLSVAHASEY